MTVSPWQEVLGARFHDLDDALTAYFSAIPPGRVGRGSGVFEVVGTPRRWLWPVLAVLGRAGIVFPVWQHDVPFEVENRPVDGGVEGRRAFRFATGERTMRDWIGMTPRGLVDRLGRHGRIEAVFAARVVAGYLELRSTGVAVRLGRLRIPVPRFAAPQVALVERFDAEAARQHVSLTLDAPVLGRIYEYSGSFRYEVTSA